jgi:hypothetical protein
VRVQRRASNSGVIMVVGQKIALGRAHAHTTVTVYVADTNLTIETDDGDSPAPSPAPPPNPSATSDPCGPAKPPHRNLGLC